MTKVKQILPNLAKWGIRVFLVIVVLILIGPLVTTWIMYPRVIMAEFSPDGAYTAEVIVRPVGYHYWFPPMLWITILGGEGVEVSGRVLDGQGAMLQEGVLTESEDTVYDAEESLILWETEKRVSLKSRRHDVLTFDVK